MEKNKAKTYTTNSCIRWPIQNLPCLSTFHIWQRYILQITNSDKNGKIKKGNYLGTWCNNAPKTIRIKTWIHHSKLFIIKKKNDLWYKHHFINENITTKFYAGTASTTGIYENDINFAKMVPVDLIQVRGMYAVKLRTMSSQDDINEFSHGEISTNIPNGDIWEVATNELKGLEYIFQNTKVLHKSNVWTKEELNLVFCSDGGVTDNAAGYGLVGSVDNNTILTNKYRLPEIFNKYTSHRSEACGLLSAIIHAQVIIKYQQMKGFINQKVNIMILCDNETVTKTVNKFKYCKPSIKDYYSADYDILDEISKRMKLLLSQGIDTKVKHIYGHQNKNGAVLSYHAKLNVHADSLATESVKMRNPIEESKLFAQATLSINKLHVPSNQKKFCVSVICQWIYANIYKKQISGKEIL
jgi:hypothetical protein